MSGDRLFHHKLKRELMKPNSHSFSIRSIQRLTSPRAVGMGPKNPVFRGLFRTCTLTLLCLYLLIHDSSATLVYCTSAPGEKIHHSVETSACGSTRTSLDYFVNVGESIGSRYRELLGACIEFWCNLDYFLWNEENEGWGKYESRINFCRLNV